MASKKTKQKKKESLEEKTKTSPVGSGSIWIRDQYDANGYPVIPTYKRGRRNLSNYSSESDNCVENFYRED